MYICIYAYTHIHTYFVYISARHLSLFCFYDILLLFTPPPSSLPAVTYSIKHHLHPGSADKAETWPCTTTKKAQGEREQRTELRAENRAESRELRAESYHETRYSRCIHTYILIPRIPHQEQTLQAKQSIAHPFLKCPQQIRTIYIYILRLSHSCYTCSRASAEKQPHHVLRTSTHHSPHPETSIRHSDSSLRLRSLDSFPAVEPPELPRRQAQQWQPRRLQWRCRHPELQSNALDYEPDLFDTLWDILADVH